MHDPNRMILRRALRVAVVVAVAFFAVQVVLGWTHASLSVAFACFSMLAFADFGGPRKSRLTANLILGAFGVALVALGGWLGHWGGVAIVCTLIIVFMIAFSAVLRGYFAAATAAAILPWAYSVTAPATGEILGWRCGGWALGALCAAVASITVWPTFTRSKIRTSLAAVLDCAADVCACFADRANLPAKAAELDQKLKVLDDAYRGVLVRPGGGTNRDRSLLLAVDETSRLATVMTWDYEGLDAELGPADARLLKVSEQAFRDCAQALMTGEVVPQPQQLATAREVHGHRMIEWSDQRFNEDQAEQVRPALEASTHIRMVSLTAQAMAIHIRGAMDPAKGVRVDRMLSEETSKIRFEGVALADPNERITKKSMLAEQLTFRSPWLRTAIRTSIALTATVLLVNILGAQHGFWVSLGALVALKFDSSGTGRTAVQVLIGTVVGFALGALLVEFGGSQLILWLLLPVLVFLAAYTPGAISLIVGQASFTVFVIDLVGITTPDKFAVAEWRLADVILGISVSLVVSLFMWPHGVAPMVLRSARAAVNSAIEAMLSSYQRIVDGPLLEEHARFNRKRALGKEARAVEVFDLSFAQRGPGLNNKRGVVSALNIAVQINFASEIIAGLSNVAEIPADFAAVGDGLLAAVQRAGSQMMSAVNVLAQDEDDLATPGPGAYHDSLDRLRATVDAQFVQLNLHSAARQGEADLHPGRIAVVIVFAMIWIVQAVWLADQMWQVIEQQPNDTVDAAK